MNDPKSPDPKPNDPRPAAPPPRPTGAYISPKLRDKLMEPDDSGGGDGWPPKSSPLPAILATVVVLAIGVGGFLWWRSSARTNEARAAAQADSLAAVARAESLTLAARADSAAMADSLAPGGVTAGSPGSGTPDAGAAGGATVSGTTATGGASRGGATGSSGGTATTPPTGGSSGGATPPPSDAEPRVPTDGFGIETGSFLFEDRAKSEMDRLVGSSGLSGIVAPKREGGETVFRVILGKFSSRTAAEIRAAALVDSSLVREAKVVPRPK